MGMFSFASFTLLIVPITDESDEKLQWLFLYMFTFGSFYVLFLYLDLNLISLDKP
jgi:hypothetical protein